MGACQSQINLKEQQQHQIQTSDSTLYTDNELLKAKGVIDTLNVQIGGLEQQLMSLKRQLSKEKQKKEERSSELYRAEQTITKMEDERAKLKVKLMRVAVVNKKSIDLDQIEAENTPIVHQTDEEIEFDATESAAFGQSQSPINIITITAPQHEDHHHHKAMTLKDEDFSGNALKFNYPEKIKRCTIINNGHTVQVNIPSSAKCKLWIYEKEFELKQFHFHTPSEHTIDGRAYECEMHLVHMNEANEICVLGFIFTTGQKYEKPRLQLTKSRAHLILAQKDSKDARVSDMRDDEEESDDLETDDEWQEDESRDKEDGAKKGNDFLSQFFDELPPQKTDQEILLKKSLSFDFLFETASKSMSRNVKTNEVEINMEIFEYMGSLTTPPYTEGVQWLLSKTTHFINEEQLQTLSACWGNENNARPVQKYFGRQVSLRSKSSLRVAT